MTKLKLNYLKMENVKGVKDLELNLARDKSFAVTNGSGKSTVLDTIMWVLTGQTDLQNRKFDPQSKTTKNKPTVSLNINVNDINHTLQITMSSKDEMLYLIDGTVMKKSEYTQKLVEWGLKDILLTANPLYLLNYLTWQEAREIITSFIAGPTTVEIESFLIAKNATINTTFNHAMTNLKTSNFDKDTVKMSITNIKNKVTYVQGQVAGLETTLAPQDINFDQLKLRKKELETKRQELENVDKREELLSKIKELNNNKEYYTHNIQILQNEINNKSRVVTDLANDIAKLSNQVETTQQEYNHKLTKQVNDECGSCHQKLDDTMVTAMRQNLYLEADIIKNKLAEIVKIQLNTKEKYINEKTSFDTFKAQAEAAITFYNKELTNAEDTLTLVNNALANSFDTASIIKIDEELLSINSQLILDNEVTKSKINNLQEELILLNVSLEEWELSLNMLEQINQFMASEVKRKLKDNFPELEIILETQLKNGSTKPNFTVSYLGVEYKDLNTAAKIKAGIIFAKGMQKLLNLKSPILLDNFEALDSKTANEFINDDLITMSVGNGEWNA